MTSDPKPRLPPVARLPQIFAAPSTAPAGETHAAPAPIAAQSLPEATQRMLGLRQTLEARRLEASLSAKRRGWFGWLGRWRKHEPASPAIESKVEPVGPIARRSEPQPPNAPAAPPQMVDLSAVREAMQNVAIERNHPATAPARSVEAGRVGVLLVNLGTPEAPTAKAVRTYLREFLSDPRVIEKDTLAWKLVLRGLILPLRPRIKARAYRKIWNRVANESPLKTITRAQAEKLAAALANTGVVVDWAMRYGQPSIEQRLKALAAQGCERILMLALYPQYSSATTATACDEAFRVLTRLRHQPSLRVAPPYYADPVYIDALASSITAALAERSFVPEAIVASYHGMPLDYVQKGDPYRRHCVRTTELLRERLGMTDANLLMTFQSRFGRAEWLQPYTDETLRKLAKRGVKNVAVVTPGFSADCLETLEEIAIENAHAFKKRGGRSFVFIPCLNDSEDGMRVIREIAARELMGWV